MQAGRQAGLEPGHVDAVYSTGHDDDDDSLKVVARDRTIHPTSSVNSWPVVPSLTKDASQCSFNRQLTDPTNWDRNLQHSLPQLHPFPPLPGASFLPSSPKTFHGPSAACLGPLGPTASTTRDTLLSLLSVIVLYLPTTTVRSSRSRQQGQGGPSALSLMDDLLRSRWILPLMTFSFLYHFSMASLFLAKL